MEKSKRFKKNFIWNIIGTGFNAFNSLFFLIIVTRVNGLNDAGIFTLAFSTSCILYMIGIYAGRIYQVTECDKSITDKEFIINRIISCLLMWIIIFLFVTIKKYDIYKSSIFIILVMYKSIEAFSEVIYGVLQKNDLLDKVGKSFFFKAIISVILFLIIDIVSKNLIVACISIVVTNLAILFFYDFKNIKQIVDLKLKVNKNNVIKIFKDGIFVFLISFLGLYITNAPKYAIDNYLVENLQAIFGIIIMPATVMGLLAQFLIHPYLNQIVNFYEEKNFKKIKKITIRLVLSILVLGIICSILGYLLGTQLLGFVYNIELKEYALSLFIILIGATLYTMAGIMMPILITMRCTFIEFIISLVVVILELLICNKLVIKYELNGAVIGYFIAMSTYFILFAISTIIVINKKEEKELKKEKIII